MTQRRTAALALLLALPLSSGCAGLDLKRVNSAEAKPNNVWVFFNVKDGKEGVGNLKSDDFSIFEDDKAVSKFESKQEILNPEVAAVMYTMLLIDMSGSISAAGKADQVVDAAKTFSDRVSKSQKVGVYVFDGSAKITSVTPFTESKGSVEGGIDGLKTWKAQDPSTNLHGAIVEGVRELKTQLDRDPKPLKFGTLVVFTDGTDQAARVKRDDMMKELRDDKYENYQFYTVGVGTEFDQGELKDIGRDGSEFATDQTKIQASFDKIATRIEDATKSYYLLSYCSPARAGKHEVRIEANVKDEKSGSVASGSLTSDFDATGFTPNCDPNQKPNFDLTKGDALAPVKKDDAKKDEVKAGASGTIQVQTPKPAPTSTGETFTP